MTKEEFKNLFLRALNLAADNADRRLAAPIPRSLLVELHGAGSPGNIYSPDEAFERIYIGPDRFYRVIDVAIIRVDDRNATVFVRVSGHPPSEFSATWDPTGTGPFQQATARINDLRKAP